MKASAPTIVDAFRDDQLFGRLFQPLDSWRRWLILAKVAYGIALDSEESEIFRHHTGRSTPRPGGYAEIVVISGRQSGKTKFASAIVSFEALRAKREPGQPSPYALLVAQNLRAVSRASFAYIREAFEAVPALAQSVVGETASTLELANGCTAAIYPCKPSSVRGIRATVVCLDEIAFFESTEGFPRDVEMMRAVRPCVATTNGKIFITSSPYGRSGLLYDLTRKHFGVDDSPVLIWRGTAPQMNPSLPSNYLERMRAEDPEAAAAEIDGEFRAGISQWIDPETLREVVADGIRERPYEPGARYFAFSDPASGSGRDSFTIAIGHLDYQRDLAVLDLVRAWPPPFSPSGVISEASDTLTSYGLADVVSDRFSLGFVAEGFRSNNIHWRASERDRSAIYLELLPAINSQRVSLLDDPEMLREFRGLERRRGTSGRDRIDHRSGSHDDRANSAAGCLGLALSAKRYVGYRVVDMHTGQVEHGWDHEGNEWRGGRPWSGIFPPERDGKGRPLDHPSRFVDGKFAGHVISKKGEEDGKAS